MDETERRARVARLITEIKTLKIGGAGDDYSKVRRLRPDKIGPLAERLANPGELPLQYSMYHLVKRLDALAAQHAAELLITQDQARGERLAGAPGDDEVSKMTAEEKLTYANRLAHLLANAKKREDAE